MSTVVTVPSEPTNQAIIAALAPPDPISNAFMPGRRSACSSMKACSSGAETVLIGTPCSSHFTCTAAVGV
jgi:polysaccharide deacetylase 2 family uncharacterized protein YibQ